MRPMSDLQADAPVLVDHPPKQSGRMMTWGVALLVPALVVLAVAFMHSMNETKSVRIDAVPYYFVAIVVGVPALLLVLTAFTRLAANVEQLVAAAGTTKNPR